MGNCLGATLSPPPLYFADVFGTSTNKHKTCIVQLSTGAAKGLVLQSNIFSLRGVPFATASRLQPPLPLKPWPGDLDCTSYGPAQPQGTLGSRAFYESWKTALLECIVPPLPDGQSYTYGFSDEARMLNLNVWTPGIDDRKRPVMVWIHGGKFQMGSNMECGMYDGNRLAARGDVVVVAVNYRFAGFAMSVPDEVQNITMRDIIASLEWVQREIHALGGDPENVTIMGQSAGGIAVTNLLASPHTNGRGLFQKAICFSGSPLTIDQYYHGKVNDAACKALGLSSLTKAGVINASTKKIVYAGGKMDDIIAKGIPTCAPVRDGTYVHEQGALVALEAGMNKDVHLMIGNNTDELAIVFGLFGETLGKLVLTGPRMTEGLLKYLDSVMNREVTSTSERAKDLLQKMKEIIEVDSGAPAEPALVGRKAAELIGNEAGNYLTAEAHSKAGGKTYLYEFSAPSASGRTSHGDDLLFLWPLLQGLAPDYYGRPCGYTTPIDQVLLAHADAWQDAQIAFAKTGTPSEMGAVAWEPFPKKMKVKIDCGSSLEDALTPGIQALKSQGSI